MADVLHYPSVQLLFFTLVRLVVGQFGYNLSLPPHRSILSVLKWTKLTKNFKMNLIGCYEICVKSLAGSLVIIPAKRAISFTVPHHKRLSCCVMPADLFLANFFFERQTGTYHPIHGAERNGEPGRGFTAVGTKGSNRCTASHSGHTL